MRCLRKYVCTVDPSDYQSRLLINNNETACYCTSYFYMRHINVMIHASHYDSFVWHRKTYRSSTMGFAMPIRMYSFCWRCTDNYIDIYLEPKDIRYRAYNFIKLRITIDKNITIERSFHNRIPF